MGREIRRVPVTWEHPKKCYNLKAGTLFRQARWKPLWSNTHKQALAEWEKERQQWKGDAAEDCTFEEYYGSRPDPVDYMPDFGDVPLGYRVYETVSEGTPCSPAFERPEDLARYLSEHGDWYHQDRVACGSNWAGAPPSYESALAFVMSGWAPSMIATPGRGLEDGYAVHKVDSKGGE